MLVLCLICCFFVTFVVCVDWLFVDWYLYCLVVLACYAFVVCVVLFLCLCFEFVLCCLLVLIVWTFMGIVH